ncbi:hypothetical protein Gotri_025301 [Gossypium trilobum]|uniref:Uncharacterized protein n=1 Tax=Gossypium trilobum TaxID=34281 RepID=A0A7J9FSV0_9ROSI|nr:hypothetical protein [Gossypium trilobum]
MMQKMCLAPSKTSSNLISGSPKTKGLGHNCRATFHGSCLIANMLTSVR